MAIFEILLLLGTIGIIASRANHLIGGYRLLSWMKGQLDMFDNRGQTTTSDKERAAIREMLVTCDQLKKTDLNKWDFKFETLSLIEKIARIFHPNASVPIEQARLGDVLKVMQEANQKVLQIIHLPKIDYITRFRVIQIFESTRTASDDSGIKNFVLGPFYRKFQTIVVRSILIQWVLLVGEAALKIYGDNSNDENVEAEAILAEWERFQEEPDAPIPENIKPRQQFH